MLDFCRKYRFLISFLALIFYMGAITPTLLQKGLHLLSHLGSHDHHHLVEHTGNQSDHNHYFLNTFQTLQASDAEWPTTLLIKSIKAPKYAQILPDWVQKNIEYRSDSRALFYLKQCYKSPLLALIVPPPK
jgi:hypothetical protein